MPRFIIVIFFSFFVLNETQAHAARKFIIYAYIPWKKAVDKKNNTDDFSIDLKKNGILSIKIIYENDYLLQGKISLEKIKKITTETFNQPAVPISFDLEFGNRFKPETVIPKIKAILTAYHDFKPRAPVGIYAVMPQNTYGWKPNRHVYDQLNAQYKVLINDVDFISPSLYNYNGHNLKAWELSARDQFQAAHKYFKGKPIIPYISPIYRIGKFVKIKNGTLVEVLDEKAMAARLKLLYALGASGCIIWASSQDREANGQIPTFSPNKAWGKAIVEFIKLHSSGK